MIDAEETSLAELESLANQATAAPWSVDYRGDRIVIVEHYSRDGDVHVANFGHHDPIERNATAVFAIAARVAVPTLIDRIRQLKLELSAATLAERTRCAKIAEEHMLQLREMAIDSCESGAVKDAAIEVGHVRHLILDHEYNYGTNTYREKAP